MRSVWSGIERGMRSIDSWALVGGFKYLWSSVREESVSYLSQFGKECLQEIRGQWHVIFEFPELAVKGS